MKGDKMKKLFSMLMIFTLSSMVFAAATQSNKAPVKISKKYNVRVEPNANINPATGESSPIVTFEGRNGFSAAVVDSSKNGYGMIASATKPLYSGSEGLFYVYRQWAGDDGTSGQIGASFSEDGSSWTQYYNLNGLYSIGRYPSAVGNGDYPYAVWNEYTGNGQPSYGGRPFYAYDEFGWDGGSFTNPVDTDLTWNDTKDLWVGSPVHSGGSSLDYFNIAYADWTRNDCWLFHSEAYEDGYIIFGSEIKVLDETADFVGGDDEGSYTSSPVLDINNEGIGYYAASAYFSGADLNTSVVPNGSYHVPIFRMTTDHGATWFPAHDEGAATADKYYYIPDEVINDMFNSNLFPTSWTDPDECEGSEDYTFSELFMAYDFDLKVDANGDPHFVIGILPGDGEYIFPGIEAANGYYHFTINKDNLDNPGPVQSETGWRYSFVASAVDTWAWSDAAGTSYWQVSFPSLSLGPDGNMFVVSSMVSQGEENDPDGDPCTADSEYPEWSNDVYVMKSEDSGATWWCPWNASATPDLDATDIDSPEEISAHAASSADANGVYLNYQMPDYLYGSTTGDPGDPDHKCRVYVGYAELTSAEGTQPDCGSDTCGSGVGGDSNGDGTLNILDIVGIVNSILGTGSIDFECAADFNTDGTVNILDIVAIVNCILGTGSCEGGLARVVEGETGYASLAGNKLEINSFVSGLQFDGSLASAVMGHDVVESANGKTLIYNPIHGLLETSSFTFSSAPENLIVASSMGESLQVSVVSEYALMSSYPNPFNPQTTISYEISSSSNTDLAVYNMLGQQIVSLVSGYVEAGDYKAVWNGVDANGNEVASGIYMLKLSTQNQVISNKITLLR
jgi:hypothetical protein